MANRCNRHSPYQIGINIHSASYLFIFKILCASCAAEGICISGAQLQRFLVRNEPSLRESAGLFLNQSTKNENLITDVLDSECDGSKSEKTALE